MPKRPQSYRIRIVGLFLDRSCIHDQDSTPKNYGAVAYMNNIEKIFYG
jgi:hypothetical protein